MKRTDLFLAIGVALLSGCASVPPFPESQVQAKQFEMGGIVQAPNCLAFCNPTITMNLQKDDINSGGTGAVTTGAKSNTTSVTNSTTTGDKTVEPKP